MPSQKPRLLVIEDDELTRAALESVLDEEGFIVQALAEGRDADRVVSDFRPDLAIVDVELGFGPDGFTVARRMKAASDFPIFFLTGRGEVEDRLTGFATGADDYLVKPFVMAELLARVRALLRRAGRMESLVIQLSDLVVDDGARLVLRAGHAIKLTPSEYQLLLALARNPGRVLSKSQLLSHTWPFDQLDTHVVDVHLSAVRKKLEEHGPRLIHTVRGMGYVLRP